MNEAKRKTVFIIVTLLLATTLPASKAEPQAGQAQYFNVKVEPSTLTINLNSSIHPTLSLRVEVNRTWLTSNNFTSVNSTINITFPRYLLPSPIQENMQCEGNMCLGKFSFTKDNCSYSTSITLKTDPSKFSGDKAIHYINMTIRYKAYNGTNIVKEGEETPPSIPVEVRFSKIEVSRIYVLNSQVCFDVSNRGNEDASLNVSIKLSSPFYAEFANRTSIPSAHRQGSTLSISIQGLRVKKSGAVKLCFSNFTVNLASLAFKDSRNHSKISLFFEARNSSIIKASSSITVATTLNVNVSAPAIKNLCREVNLNFSAYSNFTYRYNASLIFNITAPQRADFRLNNTAGNLSINLPLKEVNRSIPLRINVCLPEPAQRPPSTADLIIRAGSYQAKIPVELRLARAFNYSPLIPGTLLGDPRRLDKGNYTLKLCSEDVSFSSDDALPLLMKSFQWLFWPIDFSSNGCYVKRGSVIGTYTPKPGEEYYLVAKEDISFRRGAATIFIVVPVIVGVGLGVVVRRFTGRRRAVAVPEVAAEEEVVDLD
ncbi:MAG: hypothetical protein LM590_08785 [Thermofilum sp.]|nr:hypothetical protein [Thermofilum sp.]